MVGEARTTPMVGVAKTVLAYIMFGEAMVPG